MLKKFAVICTLMLCVLVAGCSDDQTATVIPQPETKQTQNNKNQEITVTVYRAPVNGEEYLLPEKVTRKSGAMTAPDTAATSATSFIANFRNRDCSGDSVGYFGKQQSAGYCENGQSVS